MMLEDTRIESKSIANVNFVSKSQIILTNYTKMLG